MKRRGLGYLNNPVYDQGGFSGTRTPHPSGYQYNPREVFGRRTPDEAYASVGSILSSSSTLFLSTASGSTLILPRNDYRRYMLIQNKDAAANLYINFSADAGVTSGFVIIPTGNYLADFNCPPDDVFAFFDSATPAEVYIATTIALPPEV